MFPSAAYISHSASRERLAYVFRALLPPIPEDTMLLDIGSRLGAVLYGVRVKRILFKGKLLTIFAFIEDIEFPYEICITTGIDCIVSFQAYIYSKCRRIVGVEINPDLCQVQQTIINKYQFQVSTSVL